MNIFQIYLKKITKILIEESKKGFIKIPENLDSINVDVAPEKFNCDISTNIAMVLSKLNESEPITLATKLSEIINTSKKTGALIIGGGVSKHHTLWWNQFKGGLDYAVSFTTAHEYDGSLSGAEIREAISWSNVNSEAKQVTINVEAASLLPFMIAAVIERISK